MKTGAMPFVFRNFFRRTKAGVGLAGKELSG